MYVRVYIIVYIYIISRGCSHYIIWVPDADLRYLRMPYRFWYWFYRLWMVHGGNRLLGSTIALPKRRNFIGGTSWCTDEMGKPSAALFRATKCWLWLIHLPSFSIKGDRSWQIYLIANFWFFWQFHWPAQIPGTFDLPGRRNKARATPSRIPNSLSSFVLARDKFHINLYNIAYTVPINKALHTFSPWRAYSCLLFDSGKHEP